MSDPQPPGWTEAERLEALHRTGLLDTPPEDSFDDLARLAAELLGAPMAALQLVAEHRQWGKAEFGFARGSLPRALAFCPVTLHEPDGLVIPDATRDPRFAGNPLVTGSPGLRFYAGMPVRAEGLPIGVLCVLDTQPRPAGLDARERGLLQALARQASTQIALRQALAQREAQLARRDRADALRRRTLDSAIDIAILATDLEGRITGWNTGAETLFGWSAAEALGQPVALIFTPEDRAAQLPVVEMRASRQHGRVGETRWHQRKDGSRIWSAAEMLPLRDETGEQVGFLKVLRDRTQQRGTGEGAEAINERYRLAQRATRDAIWDWDLTTNAVHWNEALESAYGWAPAAVEPTGAWWLATIHPEDRERVGRDIHAVIQGSGTSWSGEYRFGRADGSYAQVRDRGYVIRDQDGRAIRMIGAMLDRSELERADAALRDRDDRLRLATAAAGIGTFDYHVRSGSLIWDNRCRALVGLSPDAPVTYAGTFLAGLHPEDRERVDAAVCGALDPAGTGQISLEYRTIGIEDGVERWVFANGETHFEQGEPVRLIGTVLDITDRKRAEAVLQAMNTGLEQLVQNRTRERDRIWTVSTDLLAIWGRDGRAKAVNPAWTTDLGHPAEALRGMLYTDLAHPEDVPELQAAWQRLLAGEPVRGLDIRLRHHDGSYRSHSLTCIPEGEEIYATGHNVTEERALEAQLRQSQKMEAVGQLTGGIAHDFNNLLTGIIGALELLNRRLQEGRLAETGRYIVTAQGAAKRAAALTHRLLAFSRRQTLDPRPTEVNRLIAGMEELIRRSIGPAITLEVVGAPRLWPTLVDPNQLENALLNLCINARDAMPDGGRLTIETTNARLDARAARERDLPPGQYVAIAVTDTGVGMTPEVVARAFDPFFTTKPFGQGTGLGLSMIYGFARQSGGQARIYSEPGRGTTMRLYLPRHRGDAEAGEALPGPPAPQASPGETVLVVDDEPTIRAFASEVLSDLGYAVLEAVDAASGLALLQSPARIDLLVTDVGLPGGMNGRQMADAARQRRPGLKVLFITGYAEHAVIGNGHLDPGMHVMTKPFTTEALASRIREVLAG